MTTARIAVALVGVIVALAIASGILAARTIDLATVKRLVQQEVWAAYRLRVVFAGPLRVTYTPWIGIAGTDVTLHAGPEGTPALATVDTFSFRAKLRPLLSGRLEMESVVLRGLDVTLERPADGPAPWESLTSPLPPTTAPDERAARLWPQEGMSVERIAVSGGRITYRDEASGLEATIRNLDMEVDAIRPGIAAPVKGSLTVDLPTPGVTIAARAFGHVALDGTFGLRAVRGLTIKATLDGPAVPPRHGTIQVLALADYDVAGAALVVKELTAGWPLGSVAGDLTMTAQPLSLGASLNVETTDLPGLLGFPAPAGVPQKAALTVDFRLSEDGLSVHDLTLDSPAARLRGWAEATPGDAPRLRFAAEAERLNLPPLLALVGAAGAGQSAVPADVPLAPLVALLRRADVAGRLRAREIGGIGPPLRDASLTLGASASGLEIRATATAPDGAPARADVLLTAPEDAADRLMVRAGLHLPPLPLDSLSMAAKSFGTTVPTITGSLHLRGDLWTEGTTVAGLAAGLRGRLRLAVRDAAGVPPLPDPLAAYLPQHLAGAPFAPGAADLWLTQTASGLGLRVRVADAARHQALALRLDVPGNLTDIVTQGQLSRFDAAMVALRQPEHGPPLLVDASAKGDGPLPGDRVHLHYGRLALDGQWMAVRDLRVRGLASGRLAVQGDVRAGGLLPRTLADRLGITLPPMGPQALRSAALAATVAAGPDGLTLSDARLRVDDVDLRGELRLRTGPTTDINFALHSGPITVDRYLDDNNLPDTATLGADFSQLDDAMPLVPPILTLDRVTLNGTLAAQALIWQGTTLRDLSARITTNAGVLSVTGLRAVLDPGGPVAGDVHLGLTGRAPLRAISLQMQGWDLDRLMRLAEQPPRASGRLDLSLSLRSNGVTVGEVRRRMTGHLGVKISDAVLRTFATAEDAAQGRADSSLPITRGVARFNVNDGIVSNHDLKLIGPDMQITGRGSADITTRQIDYTLVATYKGIAAPVTVRGPLDKPQVQAGYGAAVGSIIGILSDLPLRIIGGIFGGH